MPRILFVAIVMAAYAATLFWASEISAHGDAAPIRDTAWTAGGAATAQLDADTTADVAVVREDSRVASREAPLMTMAIAVLALLVAGGWYAIRRLRPRTPVRRRLLLARHARLAVRYLTTLL